MSIVEITNAAIERIARRGGVKRMSGFVYDEIRGIMKMFLENILRSSVIRVESTGMKTLKIEHVLPSLDVAMYSTAISDFKCHLRDAKKDDAIKEIRHFQNSGCLLIPLAPFERVVKAIIKDLEKDFRVSEKAILLIQYATEAHFTKLFNNTMRVAIHADRVMIMPKDIQLARSIANDGLEEGVKTEPIIQSVPKIDFSHWIKFLLKRAHGGVVFSTDACSQINFILNTLAIMLIQEARSFASLNNEETITPKHLEYAIKEVMPADLAKHALKIATDSLTKNPDPTNPDGVASRLFPASKVHTLLKGCIKMDIVEHKTATGTRRVLKTGGCANRVSKDSSVYLAAVLEYMTEEYLELTTWSARDDNRKRITARDLQKVIENDEQLKDLKAKMGVDILGGGVMPHIYTALLPKKE
jgi:histone H3/H4